MPIDTRIDGDPADVQRVGDWVRSALGVVVLAATDDAESARRIADDAWDGTASAEFLTVTSTDISAADRLHSRVLAVASRYDTIATQLSSVHGNMAAIREGAAAAGLTVLGDTIADPHDPSDDVCREAYENARIAAEDTHRRWAEAVAALTDNWSDEAWAAAFIGSTGLDYLKTELEDRIGILLRRADNLTVASIDSMRAVLDLPDGTPYEQVRRSVGSVQGMLDDAASAARAADSLTSPATTLRRAAGPIGLVAGIGIDYYGGGESLGQAVVSNGAGLAVSIVAGAASGAAIGSVVPGLGTAVGAVGGTVGGIFASGVVDDLFENGAQSIGRSIGAGGSELKQAGTALLELGDVAVGGLVAAGKGISNAFS